MRFSADLKFDGKLGSWTKFKALFTLVVQTYQFVNFVFRGEVKIFLESNYDPVFAVNAKLMLVKHLEPNVLALSLVFKI